MHVTTARIVPLVAMGVAAVAIAAAPIASASTLPTGASIDQNPGNAEITATPGDAAQEAAQLQQPFGGVYGVLLFHH
ncbi:hypothetical protein BTO20_24510 [Mycobacterium dioxanotrophicus]|jgi:hypothetical protein|uniref:Uncharacterized protein n=1 Tax=Mycobacterium dioxanotrophicus TaxID=482462 RepID=A0A1Y0C7S3_9MYCO|nr:hypothetical protein [Mycobacterium dioxanotrophicus]ART71288.1 hypothetical protein BTO20_24510 [Mycobacterium dioxanotrophicus]